MNRIVYRYLKWGFRLAILSVLLFPALYWGAWRSGIIKYACMQPESQTMRDTWAFMANPLLGPAIDLSLMLWCFGLVYCVAELKYRSRLGVKFREALTEIRTKWYLWIPVISLYCWVFFYENRFTHVSGVSWIVTAYGLVFLVLTSKR